MVSAYQLALSANCWPKCILSPWMVTVFVSYNRQDELGLIEEKYDKYYHNHTISIAEATLKNQAAGYSRDEYIANRSRVEQGLHDALRLKLGGNLGMVIHFV